MAETRKSRAAPPGLLGGVVFFIVVAAGCSYIVFSKLHGFAAVQVTLVPVAVMVGYALLLGLARLFRLRDDQSGDNLYYMGFLFTLTSLGVSLYQYSSEGSAEQIVQNFGIAIASTIAGIALRIFFNQMRRDPVEVEQTARLELADASRKVKRELDSAVLEFGYFRRTIQQSIEDSLAEGKELLKEAKNNLATWRICRGLQQTDRGSGPKIGRDDRRAQYAHLEIARRGRGQALRRCRPYLGERRRYRQVARRHSSETREHADPRAGDRDQAQPGDPRVHPRREQFLQKRGRAGEGGRRQHQAYSGARRIRDAASRGGPGGGFNAECRARSAVFRAAVSGRRGVSRPAA
jgi:hypothetical protein